MAGQENQRRSHCHCELASVPNPSRAKSEGVPSILSKEVRDSARLLLDCMRDSSVVPLQRRKVDQREQPDEEQKFLFRARGYPH